VAGEDSGLEGVANQGGEKGLDKKIRQETGWDAKRNGGTRGSLLNKEERGGAGVSLEGKKWWLS